MQIGRGVELENKVLPGLIARDAVGVYDQEGIAHKTAGGYIEENGVVAGQLARAHSNGKIGIKACRREAAAAYRCVDAGYGKGKIELICCRVEAGDDIVFCTGRFRGGAVNEGVAAAHPG